MGQRANSRRMIWDTSRGRGAGAHGKRPGAGMRRTTVAAAAIMTASVVAAPVQADDDPCGLRELARVQGVSGAATLVAADPSVPTRALVTSNAELAVFDLTDPEVPVVLGSVPVANPEDLAVGGDVAAWVGFDRVIRLIDLSDPSRPREAASIVGESFPSFAYEYTAVAFSGGLLYTLRNFDEEPYGGSLVVFDVSNPDAPQEIGQSGTGFALGDLTISADRAFAAGLFLNSSGSAGLPLWAVFEISQPGSPTFCRRVDWWVGFVGGWNTPDEGPLDVASSGRRAVGMTSSTSSGPILDRARMSGTCPPRHLENRRTIGGALRTVAADDVALYINEQDAGEDVITVRTTEGQTCIGASGIRFNDMESVGGLLLGTGDGGWDLTVLTAATRQCPPGTEGSLWNRPHASSLAQFQNNCYNYGVNRRTDSYEQLGSAGGITLTQDGLTCAAVEAAAEADGLLKVADPSDCPDDSCAVVVYVMPAGGGNPRADYHWYRLNTDGTWSHKLGFEPATNTDTVGALILDPQTADRRYRVNEDDLAPGYTVFCSYFCVPHDFVLPATSEGYSGWLPPEATTPGLEVVVSTYGGFPSPRWILTDPDLIDAILSAVASGRPTDPRPPVFGYGGFVIRDAGIGFAPDAVRLLDGVIEIYDGAAVTTISAPVALERALEAAAIEAGTGEVFQTCAADVTGDGDVGILDLLTVLSDWGVVEGASESDLDGDGIVGILDLLTVLGNWGPCP